MSSTVRSFVSSFVRTTTKALIKVLEEVQTSFDPSRTHLFAGGELSSLAEFPMAGLIAHVETHADSPPPETTLLAPHVCSSPIH